MSFNRWMVKQTVVHTYDEILLSGERKRPLTSNNLGKSAKEFWWAKIHLLPKCYILYDSIYKTCLKWKHFRNEKTDLRFSEDRAGGREMREGGGCDYKRVNEGFLLCWNYSLFWLRWWVHVPTHMCVCSVAQSCPALWPYGLYPTRLCPWNFPGKNTGVGCHFLLHGISLTQELNPWLMFPALAGGLFVFFLTTVPPGKPAWSYTGDKIVWNLHTHTDT